MIHGGKDVPGAGGPGGGVFGTGIGGADHLAHAQAAAGEDDGHGARPVIAAGSGVDPRSAAKLAVAHYQDAPVQAAVVEVLDQGGDGPVVARQIIGAEGLEVIVVRVPAAHVDGDVGDAGFHEPAGQKGALAPGVPAIAIAHARVLAVDV